MPWVHSHFGASSRHSPLMLLSPPAPLPWSPAGKEQQSQVEGAGSSGQTEWLPFSSEPSKKYLRPMEVVLSVQESRKQLESMDPQFPHFILHHFPAPADHSLSALPLPPSTASPSSSSHVLPREAATVCYPGIVVKVPGKCLHSSGSCQLQRARPGQARLGTAPYMLPTSAPSAMATSSPPPTCPFCHSSSPLLLDGNHPAADGDRGTRESHMALVGGRLTVARDGREGARGEDPLLHHPVPYPQGLLPSLAAGLPW